MESKPNVLICAYACNPFKGSEEAVGWDWVKAIARHNAVTVITAAYQKKDIEIACADTENWAREVRFIYCRYRPWHYYPGKGWVWIENSLCKPIVNWAYRLWLRDALSVAESLARQESFDLTHQITYVGFRFPGHLWKLDIPFVWGPLGGIETMRWRLLPTMDWWGILYYAAHNLVNSAHRRFLRAPARALAKAGPGVIAATSGIQRELARWYDVESRVICEVTAPELADHPPKERKNGEALRLAWSGQHFSRKALPLLFRALADLPSGTRWQLDIFGAGPKTDLWKRQARKLGIDRECTWIGRVPRDEAIAGLARAHLFVITSLKDLTSTVILEAMSQGVPVLCPDHCGFSDVVTSESGIKLSIDTPEIFVAGMRDAIAALFCHEARRRQLAWGARDRAKVFQVEAKAEEIRAVYDNVLQYHAAQNSVR